MKHPVLTLVFRNPDDKSEVHATVLQSAIYIQSHHAEQVRQQLTLMNEHFQSCGFHVFRTKLEALAYGNDGIPQFAEDMIDPKRYFEFHFSSTLDGHDPTKQMTLQEEDQFRKASAKISEALKVPIPLSYNNDPAKFCFQRFLNARFRGMGIVDIKPKLKGIIETMNDHGIKIIKTIAEYVVYDDKPEVDQGWIDYTKEELEKLFV